MFNFSYNAKLVKNKAQPYSLGICFDYIPIDICYFDIFGATLEEKSRVGLSLLAFAEKAKSSNRPFHPLRRSSYFVECDSAVHISLISVIIRREAVHA